jgi:hypothetical protein
LRDEKAVYDEKWIVKQPNCLVAPGAAKNGEGEVACALSVPVKLGAVPSL